MADPTYYAVLTKAGADLEARALETGKGVVLTHIAVGDANRKEIVPEDTVTALVHEVCRRPIDSRELDELDSNVCLLHATIPGNVGGFWIHELGVIGHLEGETGEVLYAYANHAPYYKMLPQFGQVVTHELIVPIVQRTDATLIIQMLEEGYVIRRDFVKMGEEFGYAIASLCEQCIRLSRRCAFLELGNNGGSGSITIQQVDMDPAGYRTARGSLVAPVTMIREGASGEADAALTMEIDDLRQ